MQLIDVVSGEIEDVVLFDDAGGWLTFDGNAVVVSDDGRAAYIAGDLNGEGEDAARVFRVELADRSVTFHTNPSLEEYTGARLAADGRLYLSGVTCRDDVCRSLVERCHPVFLACEELAWLEDEPVIAERLTLAPDGHHLLVQRMWRSAEPDGGAAGLLDLNGRRWTVRSHERAVTSAVRLPDGRTLGGLPYFANDNEDPELTWIGGPGDWFPEGGDGSVGSFFGALDVTALFGDRL